MKIDTSIIDNYLESKSAENFKNHWIYNKIVEGKYLFSTPPMEHIDKHTEIKELLVKTLKDFKPIKQKEWEEVYGHNYDFSEDTNTMIVIGSPEPYDAFVRSDDDGNKVMVFDVERMRKYYDFIEKAVKILVTHELSHIKANKIYKFYKDGISNKEKLKQTLFDEGFAHYLTYSQLDDLNDQEKYLQYKSNAYEKLFDVIGGEITQEIIDEGNSGPFWDKYISISGFFTIFDYIADGGSAKDLFTKGYEYFWNYWMSKVIQSQLGNTYI